MPPSVVRRSVMSSRCRRRPARETGWRDEIGPRSRSGRDRVEGSPAPGARGTGWRPSWIAPRAAACGSAPTTRRAAATSRPGVAGWRCGWGARSGVRGEGPAKPEAEGAMAVDLWGLEARHAEDGVLEGTEAEGAALDEFDRIGPEPHLFQGRRGRKKWGGASTIRWGRGGGPRAKGVPRVAVCASCALARRTTCRGRTRGPGEGERQGEREVESEVVWQVANVK